MGKDGIGLASAPGVGPVVARTPISELPESATLDRRQFAARAGLAPWTRQSGQWNGKSVIGGGRQSARSVLFLAAMAAGRHNPALKALREKLGAEAKPKRVALIATARTLPTILKPILPQPHPARQTTIENRLTDTTVDHSCFVVSPS